MQCQYCNKEFENVKEFAYHLIEEANKEEKAKEKIKKEANEKMFSNWRNKIESSYKDVKEAIKSYNKEAKEKGYTGQVYVTPCDLIKVSIEEKQSDNAKSYLDEIIENIFNI